MKVLNNTQIKDISGGVLSPEEAALVAVVGYYTAIEGAVVGGITGGITGFTIAKLLSYLPGLVKDSNQG